MADKAAKDEEILSEALASDLHAIHDKVVNMPKGCPGECVFCGYWSGRLVNDVCAPCRDENGLP